MTRHTQSLCPNKRVRVKGFTLLEVLVALIFFALIGTVLQQVTASTVGQYHTVRLKTFATWIAENKLAELRLSKTLPNAREYKEDLSYAGHDWKLISKVSNTNNPDIRRVEVSAYSIDGESGEQAKRVSLTGFVGRY